MRMDKTRYGAYRIAARAVRVDKHNATAGAELTADVLAHGVFRRVDAVRFDPWQYPISEVIAAVRQHGRGVRADAYPFAAAMLDRLDARNG